MNEARALAEQLGLRTASEIDAPPVEPVRRAPAVRWTKPRREVWDVLRPLSISLVATDGPFSIVAEHPGGGVAYRLGHNRAIWPARIVTSTARHDIVTTIWNRFPGMFLGTQARLFVLREHDRDRLSLALVDLITERSERDGGRVDAADFKGFQDLGPDIDLRYLEIEMHDVARRLGILAWDEGGLVQWFDAVNARIDRLVVERDFERSARLIAKLAWQDVDAWERDLKGERR